MLFGAGMLNGVGQPMLEPILVGGVGFEDSLEIIGPERHIALFPLAPRGDPGIEVAFVDLGAAGGVGEFVDFVSPCPAQPAPGDFATAGLQRPGKGGWVVRVDVGMGFGRDAHDLGELADEDVLGVEGGEGFEVGAGGGDGLDF